MRIVLTGGGTGGHFYPLIAVAEELNRIKSEQRIATLQLYFMSVDPYDEGLLYDNNISFRPVVAGKKRTYFSLKNYFDILKTIYGIIAATWSVFKIYPDVVFSKGGFASVPAVFAARLLRIPVVIHESDTVPGRANKWAGKFARRIALAFSEAREYFPEKDNIAHVGMPIRRALLEETPSRNAHNEFSLDSSIQTIVILGGSTGAQKINDCVVDALPRLLGKYQIIHQTGKKNFEQVKEESELVLGNNQHKGLYRPVPYLDTPSMKAAADIASLIVTRAGATALSEIAVWGVPSVVIPISETNGDHQRKNAFAYARLGAGEVIEEKNLTPNILVAEITRLMDHPEIRDRMKIATEKFVHPDAATKIAGELIELAVEHGS